MIEKRVGGRYIVQNILGAGGMGTVYKGLDTQTKQTVAIKQLHSNLADEQLIERFKREGESLRELNHPNIVKMLDAIEEGGEHFLVMEFVAGSDLSGVLKQGLLPVERVLNIAIDLADALTRAHRLEIIHRDLKPANILMGDDGILRLTDFGVAHVGSKERVTDTDAIVGTIDYLPPEAFDDSTFDERGDIWAFGVILFEMLTGKRPFAGTKITEVITNILTAPTPDLEDIRDDIPTNLIDLVYRMLEKDCNVRIRSVRQIGLEIEDLIHGRANYTPAKTRFETPLPENLVYHAPKDNLPTQTTPFVGRESELAELAKLLENPKLRLMTILAPGGMGKTRLALEIAQHILNTSSNTGQQFADGTFFVELAPLNNSEQIIPSIASATNYQFQEDGRAQKQQVLDFLRNKQLLLIMDNFEHLMDGASLVMEILESAQNIQILATSRQRLGQAGETLFHLGGMDFPDWETPEDALRYAAVQLFINSAQRAKPEWELTEENLDYVARICRLVQGMPLGIVLAAAWLAMLTEAEIASELDQSMDILSDELGDLPERQKSIRAVMDYSWQMMTPAEQNVFMKLAVFQGGFNREAAQDIAGANLRILMSLVHKSLIRRSAETGRYTVHELLRQYALEKLQENNLEAGTRIAHSRYFVLFVAGITDQFSTTFDTNLIPIDKEYENIIVAWRDAIKWQDLELLEQGLSFYLYLSIRLKMQEGFSLFSDLLALVPEENKILRAKVMSCLTTFSFGTGNMAQGIAYSKQSLSVLKNVEDAQFYYLVTRMAEALIAQITQGMDTGLKLLADTSEAARKVENNFVMSFGDGYRVYLMSTSPDHKIIDESEQLSYQMVDRLRKTNQRHLLNVGLRSLGQFPLWHGNYEEAQRYLNETKMMSLQDGSLTGVIDNTVLLAQIAFNQDDHILVDTYLDEIETLSENLGLSPISLVDATAVRARLYLVQGDGETCRKILIDLLPLPRPSLIYAGFVVITAIDWLIHEEQLEQANRMLHFVISQPITLTARKSAHLLINQLAEMGVEKTDETEVAQMDFAGLIQELKDVLGAG